jgi:16S rRNA (uracil1498-N3)-methyltransferase
MNLILLFENDFVNKDQVRLTDRRMVHINTIHKASIGDSLSVGLINATIGVGKITHIDETSVTMDVTLVSLPPPPLPLTLVLALPRPNMLKRSLQTCAAMGVKKLILLDSARVQKSYWQTPQLTDKNIQQNLVLGLEQAKDTVLPQLVLEKNFKHFVEDRLPAICQNSLNLVAHPNSKQACPSELTQETTLLIGPEGGFIDNEIERLNRAGCKSIHIGKRILRVETAVPVLLAKLFY